MAYDYPRYRLTVFGDACGILSVKTAPSSTPVVLAYHSDLERLADRFSQPAGIVDIATYRACKDLHGMRRDYMCHIDTTTNTLRLNDNFYSPEQIHKRRNT